MTRNQQNILSVLASRKVWHASVLECYDGRSLRGLFEREYVELVDERWDLARVTEAGRKALKGE